MTPDDSFLVGGRNNLLFTAWGIPLLSTKPSSSSAPGLLVKTVLSLQTVLTPPEGLFFRIFFFFLQASFPLYKDPFSP